MNENEKQQALNILEYWHKIEFFNSADLGDITHVGNGGIHYDLDEIIGNPDCLPWINRNHIRRAGKKYAPNKYYTYKVYLGLFHRSEIFEAGRRYFPKFDELNPEFSERKQDSGLTCSMILHVNVTGQIVLDETEISTAPWAISKVQQGSLASIKLDDFDKDCEKLNKRFEEIYNVAASLKEEYQYPSVLTTYELVEFLKALGELIQFQPSSEQYIPSVIIKLEEKTYKNGQVKPQLPDFSFVALPDFSTIEQRLNDPIIKDKSSEAQEQSEQSAPIQSISILNSFYIRDLELVIDAVKKGTTQATSSLVSYLGHIPSRESDLLSQEGQSLIRKHLSLDMTPSGRWPGEDEHSMSLMQQFAINTIYKELDEKGIYSVNGPPGTGKTTMLRDIIANNFVSRAHQLSTLSSIKDSVTGSMDVYIGDKRVSIPVLNPSLTGYEMVVVSSNNTAVENITKELPQAKALGQRYLGLEFFKNAAQKLAAKHIYPENEKEKIKLKSLNHDEDCWGLMAAAIGNQHNRTVVGDHLFFKKTCNMVVDDGAESYQTLFDNIKEKSDRSNNVFEDFYESQKIFKQAESELATCINELKNLQFIEFKKQKLTSFNTQCKQLEWLCLKWDVRLGKLTEKQLSGLFFFLPRFWKMRSRLSKMTGRYKRRCNEKTLLERKITSFKTELDNDIAKSSEYKDKYLDAKFSDDSLDLETAIVQRTAFAHCVELNQKRANLSSKAFELHQAWILAAYKEFNLGYDSVLFHLNSVMSNKIKDVNGSKTLWQWLFMFIPVVSSTFASVARQFARFGAEDIGWLFIDEAGQASPQQAVGALYRAKRAIVVGDPLQIEPVFTIPPEFVEGFAKEVFGESGWAVWSPTKASVQNLADRVNRYGTAMIAKDEWMGSPLRVHRRCDEPMFSISNNIAYNGKMFHGSEAPEGKANPVWGKSSWIDISGEIDGKHYVPAQGQYVAKMVYQYFSETHTLPDVYIISPFRKVASGVEKEVSEYLKRQGIASNEVKDWIKGRVGTVHTFQGKEEKSVIFVLGLSDSSKGAALWASGKANILNVAVTRAKKNVYIVGSKKIWSGLLFFNEADRLLPNEDNDIPELVSPNYQTFELTY